MEQYEMSEALKLVYGCKKKTPFLVQVPKMNCLTFEGKGHPEEEDFQIACEALYTLSYLLKFEIARKKLDIDFKVSPMEVKWHIDRKDGKASYIWVMMIRQPEFITKDMIDQVIEMAKKKGKQICSDRVEFRTYEEEQCVQAFHKGDYNEMNGTLEKMIQFAKDNHLKYEQYTHDIYLNDSRKTQVQNLKTIMRIKVEP